jgi:hypothetical protein
MIFIVTLMVRRVMRLLSVRSGGSGLGGDGCGDRGVPVTVARCRDKELGGSVAVVSDLMPRSLVAPPEPGRHTLTRGPCPCLHSPGCPDHRAGARPHGAGGAGAQAARELPGVEPLPRRASHLRPQQGAPSTGSGAGHAGGRLLATVFVAVVVALALAYTCYSSLRRGYVTNRTCFVTFLVGVAYEVAVAGTVSAALWHAYLPALLAHKLGLDLSLAFTGPFR